MKEKHPVLFSVAVIGALELLLGALTVGIFAFFPSFDYTVPLGAVLGALTVTANFAALSVLTTKAVDASLAEFGGEHTEEEAKAFAEENAQRIKAKVAASQIVRMLSMLGVLVLAFLSEQFNVIATVIPMLGFRPLLILADALGKKVSNG